MVASVVVVMVDVLPPERVSVLEPPRTQDDPRAPLSLKVKSPIVRFALKITVVAAVISEVKLAVKPEPSATTPSNHEAVFRSSQFPPVVEVQLLVAAEAHTVQAKANKAVPRAIGENSKFLAFMGMRA